VLADISMSQVASLIAWTLDPEVVKAHELRFEELSHGKTMEKLFKEFRELIHWINQSTFRRLQKEYSHDLAQLQELIKTAREHRLI
jgi:protease II